MRFKDVVRVASWTPVNGRRRLQAGLWGMFYSYEHIKHTTEKAPALLSLNSSLDKQMDS